MGTFASWSGGHYCSSSLGPKLVYFLKKMDDLMTTLSTSTFKFQLFVNDFDELCLFHDLRFTLLLVWFPWVIPISFAYLFFSNYFNIIIFLIILKTNQSWRFSLSFSILNYINLSMNSNNYNIIIVIIINVIVMLNYIFSIIIKKKTLIKGKMKK